MPSPLYFRFEAAQSAGVRADVVCEAHLPKHPKIVKTEEDRRRYVDSWLMTVNYHPDHKCQVCSAGSEVRWRDWTKDEDGRSNSSRTFIHLIDAIARLIKSEAHTLLDGGAHEAARTILSHLAHEHHISTHGNGCPCGDG